MSLFEKNNKMLIILIFLQLRNGGSVSRGFQLWAQGEIPKSFFIEDLIEDNFRDFA